METNARATREALLKKSLIIAKDAGADPWNIQLSSDVMIRCASIHHVYGDYLVLEVNKQRFSVPISNVDEVKRATISVGSDPRFLASLCGTGLGGIAGALTGISVIPIIGAVAGFVAGYHLAARPNFELRNLSLDDKKAVLRTLICSK